MRCSSSFHYVICQPCWLFIPPHFAFLKGMAATLDIFLSLSITADIFICSIKIPLCPPPPLPPLLSPPPIRRPGLHHPLRAFPPRRPSGRTKGALRAAACILFEFHKREGCGRGRSRHEPPRFRGRLCRAMVRGQGALPFLSDLHFYLRPVQTGTVYCECGS